MQAPNGGFDYITFFGNPSFATYDLTTPIGPKFQQFPANDDTFANVPTSMGLLTFSLFEDVTFTATAVPEPSSMVLLGSALGFIGFGIWVRRRRKMQTSEAAV